MFLEIKDLTCFYMGGGPFEVKALDRINLKVNKGEFLGLIGRTGSGKTTLVQHFNGLIKPSQGTVIFQGKDLYGQERVDWREIRQKIGLVFQHPEDQLFGETVYEDVAFGPRKLGIDDNFTNQRVKEALRLVNLNFDEIKERSPFSLSRGEMRRVAIAGVLSMEPELLVMDEPTAGLDPRGRQELLEQVRYLHQEKGLTIIFVSHNMGEIARLAHRLVVMEEGKIVLEGTPGKIFKEGERLLSLGLELPQITLLMLTLKRQGRDVKTDIFTVEKAREEIMKMMKGKWGEPC
ncbi:MAG: energy-coupling factor transporter ATPase [Candidatus Syntrophonatronum acetioxidans]|uniref:Energy-coupling factor transporter ATP-binding protein EcfA2 n=1 Tax=Candidatus Syntrophonatronum acetioxidans TaxID=1795816 RepID=A0A424YH85_9FIRM|nr:MAG: energy-coupling factor transporter ATPase [Candidatus Syntrophonatronum acetioxidans]